MGQESETGEAQATAKLGTKGCAHKTNWSIPNYSDRCVAGCHWLPMDLEVIQRSSEYWLRKGNLDKIQELIDIRPADKLQVRQRIMEIWQERWDYSYTERRAHGFMPDISRRLELEHLRPSVSDGTRPVREIPLGKEASSKRQM